jgi:hypothetical protein
LCLHQWRWQRLLWWSDLEGRETWRFGAATKPTTKPKIK